MTAKENNQPPAEDSDVIDAEIIAESGNDTQDTIGSTERSSERSAGGKAGWILACLLLVFIGGLFAAPYVRSGLVDAGIIDPINAALPSGTASGSAQTERTLATLQQQVTDNNQTLSRQQEMIAQLLERVNETIAAQQQTAQDIGVLASQGGGGSSASTDVAALRTEIERLNAETARLAILANTSSPDVAALNGQVALSRAENTQLKNQLAAMQEAIAGLQEGALNTTPRGRLLITLGRIKEQAESGLSFGGELNSAQLDIAALPAIDQQLVGADFATLSRHEAGVSSFEALSRTYSETARAVKLAQEKDEGGFLANLFTVRRTDDSATGIDAVLLEAERRLAVRDVAGAISALSALEGDARAAADAWITSAKAYTDTITAIERLLRTVAGRTTPATIGGQG